MATEKIAKPTDTIKTPLQNAMQDVSTLNEDGIKVQGGKKYTQVSTRVEVFRKHFDTKYSIKTTVSEFMNGVAAKAVIIDHENREIATGHSFTTSLAKEKSIEKLETTAIGRALAAFGLAGGEYATVDEIETSEERYKEITREDKMMQRDFLYGLSKQKTVKEVEQYLDVWKEDFEANKHLKDTLIDFADNRKAGLQNGVVFAPSYFCFIDVQEAVEFAKEAHDVLETEKEDQKIFEWFEDNNDRIKAIDEKLTAKKYIIGGKTSSKRLLQHYNQRMEKVAAE